ncbi:MAG: cytoplasmic protein [Candidatus Omnitrophica bacterium]|nr:cytoplasmic protein [Candidatus Omnitrophota bacterium]
MYIDKNNNKSKQFEKFTATHLYCDNCGRSMPVQEVLLLVLPDGELYDYRCLGCHQSVGTRKETKKTSFEIED